MHWNCSALIGRGIWLVFLSAAMVLVVQPGPAVASAERIRLAAESLAKLQLPSGLLLYEVNLLDDSAGGMTPVSVANMVRQTGSVFYLADYYRRSPSPRLKAVLEAAIEAFGKHTLPIGRGKLQSLLESSGILNSWRVQMNLSEAMNWLGLLYSTEGEGGVVSPDGSYRNAVLGGTALALLAELHYSHVTGEERFAAKRRAWLHGILSLHVPGRGFRWGPTLLREAHYFNGEGWLALATYVSMFPEDKEARAALEALDDYLLDRYGSKHSPMFFQWGTMGAEVRYAATGDARFVSFIAEQSRLFLDKKGPEPIAKSGNSCAVVEGLATAERVLALSGYEPELLKRLSARIKAEMDLNLLMQILPGQDRIVLGNGATLISPNLPDFAGAFLAGRNDPLLRIDITAHCLSAMIRMDEESPAARFGVEN